MRHKVVVEGYINRRKMLASCGVIAMVALAVIIGPLAHGTHAGARRLPLAIPSAPPGGVCPHWAAYAPPNPSDSGGVLRAVTAVPGSPQFWAVGDAFDTASGFEHTLIERYDGVHWTIVPSPNVTSADSYLEAVTAVSATNVWAVGSSRQSGTYNDMTLIEHWNGSAWSIIPGVNPNPTTNVLYGVAAVSASDVWAVGYTFDNAVMLNRTLIEHWNGTIWSVVPSPNASLPGPRSGLPGQNMLFAVTAISATDIWAVGNTSTSTLIEHWNGTAWSITPLPAGLTGGLGAVAAVSSSDVMAIGGVVVHWDGTNWSQYPSPPQVEVGMSTNPTGIVVVPGTTHYLVVGFEQAQLGVAQKAPQHGGSVGPKSGFPNSKTLALLWTGSQWNIETPMSPSPVTNGLSGVAAGGTANAIWAVGSYSMTAGGNLLTLAERHLPSTGASMLCPG